MHDFSLIYDEFEQQLFEKYVDSEDYLRLLAEKIPSSTYLQQATILIDGFHSFTPQELVVLEKLIEVCKSVKIALTLDKPFTHQPHELHLFHMTGKTYFQFKEIAGRLGIKVEVQTLKSNLRAKENTSLAHIEQHFESRPTVKHGESNGVKVRGAVNRRAEVDGVAKEILRLVREENYRYKDMAIILRNTSLYHDLLETVFEEYKIPVFIDQKRSMLHHPLIEFIRSAMEVVVSGWRYESIFRSVKTDLLFPVDQDEASLREEFDVLENYVLAYGIQGHRWKDVTKKWPYRRIVGIDDQGLAKTTAEEEMEEKIHDLRILISTPLLQFEKRLKKAKTGVQYAEALYLLLEELEVPAKLEKWRVETEQSGEVSKAREHGQVWNAVLELLDQFVELIGDEKITIQLFQSTMESGLEALILSIQDLLI
jgi:ATP-dependent helicase/nuclease subunit B